MKLFYSPNSPYARIARVALRESGLFDQASELMAANRQPDNPVLGFSPAGKVPTLVHEGLAITESRRIYDYIAASSQTNALERETPGNWKVIAQEGQILGFLDGIASWVREKRRLPEQQSGFLLQVEADRAERCLSLLEQIAINRDLPSVPAFRAIALASALSLMELHDFIPAWPQGFPQLRQWFAKQTARPSMQETAPKHQDFQTGILALQNITPP